MQGKWIKFKENHYSWGARSRISFEHVILLLKGTIKEHKFEEELNFSSARSLAHTNILPY